MMKIQFGVGVDTTGVSEAIALMQKVADQAVKTASTQVKVTKRNADQANRLNAARQKEARALNDVVAKMQTAINTTINLTQEMRNLGMTNKSITPLQRTLDAYTKELSRSGITAVEVKQNTLAMKSAFDDARRSMKAFKLTGKETKNELHDLSEEAKEAAKKTQEAAVRQANAFRNLESAAVLAIGPLSAVGARIRSLGAIIQRTGVATAVFFGLFVGVGVLFAKLASAALQATQSYEKSIARLMAASGDIRVARAEFDMVAKTADRLGLRIDELAESYAKFSAASKKTTVQGKVARDMFNAISEAAASLRLDPQEVTGIFKALEQMLSKGTIQAEEMRGQFGERLPGAFKLVADSIGMTTKQMDEMLRKGLLTAETVFPKVAKAFHDAYGPLAEANAKTLLGRTNQLHNAWFKFAREFDRVTKVSGGAKVGLQLLTKTINTLAENLRAIIQLLGIFAIMLATDMILGYLTAVGGLAGMFRKLAVAIEAVNVALMMNPITGAPALLWRLVAVVGAAAGAMWAMDKVTRVTAEDMADLAEQERIAAEEAAKKAKAEELTRAGQKVIKSIDDQIDSMKYLRKAMDVMGKGFSKSEFAMLQYKTAVQLAGLESAQLTLIAQRLAKEGILVVGDDLWSVATGLAIFTSRLADAEAQAKKMADAPKVLDDWRKKIQDMNRETFAMAGGKEDLEYFKQIEQPMLELHESFKTIIADEKELAEVERLWRDALIERMRIQKEADTTEKRNQFLDEWRQKLVDIGAATNLIGKDQDTVDYYNNVIRVLEDYKKQRKENNDNTREAIELEEQLTAALIAQYEAMKRNKQAQEANKAFDTWEKKLRDIEAQTKAVQMGPDQKKFYEDVLKPLQEYNDAMDKAGDHSERRIELERRLEAALISRSAAEAEAKRIAELTNKIAKEEEALDRKRAAAQERMADAYQKAFDKIDQMQEKVASLAKGPESLRIFEQIEKPVMQFRDALEKVKNEFNQPAFQPQEIARLTEQYRELLETIALYSSPAVKAAEDIGEAFGDAFQDAITGAESLRDAVENMVKDIYAIMARALIVQPIEDQFTTWLKNQTASATQSTGGSIPSIFSGMKNWFTSGGTGNAPTGTMPTSMGTAGIGDFTKDVLGTGGEATGEAAIQTQWQAILTQFQALVTQAQTVVTTFGTSVTTFNTAIPVFQQASNVLLQAATQLSACAEMCGTGGLGGAADEGASVGTEAGNLAQWQAVLAQEQALVAVEQGANTVFTTGASMFTTGATVFATAAPMMQGAATMHITAATSLITAAAALTASAAASGASDAMSAFGGVAGARAKGGPVSPGGLYKVAENGPEMFRTKGVDYLLSPSRGYVEPMERAATYGTQINNVTVNMPPQQQRQTVLQTADRLARIQRRANARNR